MAAFSVTPAVGEETARSGPIRFVGNANWPPYHFIDSEGNPAGFGVDVAAEVCEYLRRPFTITLLESWPEAQRMAETGEADAVLGLSKTEERMKRFDFAETLDTVHVGIYVHRSSRVLFDLEDLQGSVVGVQEGSPFPELLGKFPAIRVELLNGELQGLRMLEDKELKAVIGDENTIRYLVREHRLSDIVVGKQAEWAWDYAFAAGKGKTRLVRDINEALASLKADGTLHRLRQKWDVEVLHPYQIPRQVRVLLVIISGLLGAAGIAIFAVFSFNRILRKRVRQKTEELRVKNRFLEKEILERKRTQNKLRALAGKLQIRIDEEKNHIARELHDELGQDLAMVRAGLSRVREQNSGIEAELQPIIERVDGIINTARSIVIQIRSFPADNFGLQKAIVDDLYNFEKNTGIICVVDALPKVLQAQQKVLQSLYMVFREGLTNVLRHAGAGQLRLSLSAAGETIKLEMQDNGRGITQEEMNKEGSFGLLGMSERVAQLGGSISVEGKAGEGTTISVTLPAVVSKGEEEE